MLFILKIKATKCFINKAACASKSEKPRSELSKHLECNVRELKRELSTTRESLSERREILFN